MSKKAKWVLLCIFFCAVLFCWSMESRGGVHRNSWVAAEYSFLAAELVMVGWIIFGKQR